MKKLIEIVKLCAILRKDIQVTNDHGSMIPRSNSLDQNIAALFNRSRPSSLNF